MTIYGVKKYVYRCNQGGILYVVLYCYTIPPSETTKDNSDVSIAVYHACLTITDIPIYLYHSL